jgi:hypothetical protein
MSRTLRHRTGLEPADFMPCTTLYYSVYTLSLLLYIGLVLAVLLLAPSNSEQLHCLHHTAMRHMKHPVRDSSCTKNNNKIISNIVQPAHEGGFQYLRVAFGVGVDLQWLQLVIQLQR